MVIRRETKFLFVVAASYIGIGLIDLTNAIVGGPSGSAPAYFSFSKNEYLSYAFFYLFFCALFFLLALLINSAIFSESGNSESLENEYRRAGDIETEAVLFILFIIIFFSVLSRAWETGLLEYGIEARQGKQELGGAFYVASLGGVILATRSMTPSPVMRTLKILCLLLFVVTNLLSGFRILIIWGLIFLSVNAWWNNTFKVTKRMLWGGVGVIISVFFIYEYIRASLESGFSIDFFPLASLNRSMPLTSMMAIDYYQISINAPYLTYIWEPLSAIFNYVGFDVPLKSFDVQFVTEPMYRGFLIWRGTPGSEATGLSVHAGAIFWAQGRFLGLLFGALGLAVVFCAGRWLRAKPALWRSWFGNVLFTTLLCLNESFSGAVTLGVYAIAFVLLFLTIRLILRIVFPWKNLVAPQ
jgi:hypothetical protein